MPSCKRTGIQEKKSSSSTGSYQLVGILLLDQNNQTDDDREVIMTTVRTRRLLKANRNLLRPRPWHLSSCEQRALWLCVLPPCLGRRKISSGCCNKERVVAERRRERPPFVLKQPPLASKALAGMAGKRAATIFLSLKREVLSLVQVESNLRIKSAWPLSCTINFDRGVKRRQTCQTKFYNICISIFSTVVSCALCSRWVLLASKAARVDFIIQQLWPF